MSRGAFEGESGLFGVCSRVLPDQSAKSLCGESTPCRGAWTNAKNAAILSRPFEGCGQSMPAGNMTEMLKVAE